MRTRYAFNGSLAIGALAVAVGCSGSGISAHDGGAGSGPTGAAGSGTGGTAGAGTAGAGTAGTAGAGPAGGAGGSLAGRPKPTGDHTVGTPMDPGSWTGAPVTTGTVPQIVYPSTDSHCDTTDNGKTYTCGLFSIAP